MKRLLVRNPARGTVLGTRVELADRWWQRLFGLTRRPPLEPGQGMLLRPCKAVHMFGMRYPLDVAFLDRDGRVLAVYPGLPPGGRTGWHSQADGALELPAGTLQVSGTCQGDVLSCATEEIS